MKFLGLDFGKKKIGLAYSEGLLASPVSVIVVKTQKQALSEIVQICERLGIEKIILGLSGGKLDDGVRSFGQTIAHATGRPIDYVDETLTSREAVKKMVEGKTTKKKRKMMEDAVAATIILNTYIENWK